MQMRRTFIALLLAALLPGCAWFGGDGDESGGGQTFSVSVKNSGQHEVEVKLEVLEGELLLHEDAFAVPAGDTVERDLAYDQNGTKRVRVTYQVDANGHAASGSQENAFDPAACDGTYRIAFEVQPEEQLTLVGNHGVCDVDG